VQIIQWLLGPGVGLIWALPACAFWEARGLSPWGSTRIVYVEKKKNNSPWFCGKPPGYGELTAKSIKKKRKTNIMEDKACAHLDSTKGHLLLLHPL
jgi:hypothetical protein